MFKENSDIAIAVSSKFVKSSRSRFKGTGTRGLNASLVTSHAELHRIGAEWNCLLKRSSADNLFLTWEWVSTWLSTKSHHFDIRTIVVRDANGILRGVAPFYLREFRLLGVFRLRAICVLGDTDSGSEYPGLMVDLRNKEDVIEQIRIKLLEFEKEWDFIWIPRIAAWSEVLSEVKTLFDSSKFSYRNRWRYFCAIDLPNSFERFLEQQSSERRQRIRKLDRLFRSESGFSVNRVQSEDELEGAVSQLIELHTKRWSSKGVSGSFTNRPPLIQFYYTFTKVALRRGWLRLYRLFKDGTLVATQIGYVYERVFYQLQEAFEPESEPGMGNILRLLVIRDCINEGLVEYDFLGVVTEHKQRWGVQIRKGADVIASSGSIWGTIIVTLGIWPTGKYLASAR